METSQLALSILTKDIKLWMFSLTGGSLYSKYSTVQYTAYEPMSHPVSKIDTQGGSSSWFYTASTQQPGHHDVSASPPSANRNPSPSPQFHSLPERTRSSLLIFAGMQFSWATASTF